MVPEVIKYDEPFEVNTAQLAMLRDNFGQHFAWRFTKDNRILVKVWVMKSAKTIHRLLKKIE